MKLRVCLTFLVFVLSVFVSTSMAQVDSLVAQITNSTSESFAGGISGNGRFVVFESRGNVATENPRNADGNLEIFLWDLAQRRIFQITDTKSLLFNPSGATTFDNIRVDIVNTRPVISNDGKWIAFSSNATIAYPGDTSHPPIVSTTNPGSFDANAFTAATPTPSPSPSVTPTPGDNSLTNDGNLEMWMYQIPNYSAVADLSNGDEVPFTNLAPFNVNGSSTGGTFIRVTNTVPSQLPRPATSTAGAFIADDNHDPSISDDGHIIAFVSTRDLVPAVGNPFPAEDNDEIFTFVRGGGGGAFRGSSKDENLIEGTIGGGGIISQVTKTPRGTFADPIYNKNPTISGSGGRVVFASTGDNPIVGETGGNNPSTSRNEEIFFSDLDANGAPTGTKRQVTATTPTNPGNPVNNLDIGTRMSRDGRYIAFDSYADLAGENGGTNYTSFALYLYDTTAASSPFRRIGPRSDADSAASGGDLQHYPGFTDDDVAGAPATLVFETRENIKPDGTIPSTATDGLNPDATRPTQIYSYPLNLPAATATFKRLTKFPISSLFLAATQPIPSNSVKRMTFNLALTELGTGNPDQASEAFYLLIPDETQETPATLSFATGASRLSVSASPTPTPTGTATPTPTPTASPTATPVTPSAVLGLAPGMLAVVDVTTSLGPSISPRTAVGSLQRSFPLPIELSHITLSINGVAAGIKSVDRISGRYEIFFVVPPALTADPAGTSYPLVIVNNGMVYRSTITIVPARPDIFTFSDPGPGGRAKLFNVTNRVPTREPFTVFTVMLRGGRRVSSHMRLYLTGVGSLTNAVTVRIGSSTSPVVTGPPVLVEPGVYTLDFTMPPDLEHAGDQPIVVTITVGGVTFTSRLDDTAPRVSII